MKRAVVYITIMLAIFSCKTQKIEQSTINGKFNKLFKNKDFPYAYTLQLNTDSTFKLVVRRETCMGKWELIDDFIMLKCNEEPIERELTSGYMFQREHKLQVVNKNKIKYKDFVLKRKK